MRNRDSLNPFYYPHSSLTNLLSDWFFNPTIICLVINYYVKHIFGSYSGKATEPRTLQRHQVHCKILLCARASRSTAGRYCRFGRMWFRHGCACQFWLPKYKWVLITEAEIDYRQFLVTFQLVIISKLSSECWLLHLIFCLLFISWLSQH